MYKYQGRLIFQGQDPYTSVEVVQAGNLRTLHFGSPVAQSSMYLDDPFKVEMEYNQVMLLSLVYNPVPDQVLFLGLGGGAKQKFLWKHFSCQVHSIDISPLVIDVGYRFFNIPRDPRMEIVQQEAWLYLQSHHEPLYDFIFVDLYDKEGMSSAIGYHDFFQLCRKKMQPHGILVWNLWRNVEEKLMHNAAYGFKDAFGGNCLLFKVEESSNHILYAFAMPAFNIELDLLKKNAEELSRKTGLDFLSLLSKQTCF
jgi:spermidine synthase